MINSYDIAINFISSKIEDIKSKPTYGILNNDEYIKFLENYRNELEIDKGLSINNKQETFLQRLENEQLELLDKIHKLSDFLSRPDAITIVGENQLRLLMIQLQAMQTYNIILETRLVDLRK